MPIREDFIERMVRQIVQLMAAVLRREKAGDVDGALDDLQRGYALLLGEQKDLLDWVAPESLVALFGPPERLRSLAGLCRTEGRLREKRGEDALARRRYEQALQLYGLVGPADADDEAAIAELKARLAAAP